MVIKGKHKSYVGSTLIGVTYSDFKQLFENIKPFKLMMQRDREKAIKGEWEIIKKNLPNKKAVKIEASE